MKKIFIIIIILFSKISFAIDVDDAIKSTIENNPKVKIAFEKLEESKELIENAYNQKLPTITSTISGTYSNSDSSTATASTTPESFTDKYKALTFSRNVDINDIDYYQHVGIYSYSYKILSEFVSLPRSKNEISENLEQLRFLDNGYDIYLEEISELSIGIDTEHDYKKALEIISNEN